MQKYDDVSVELQSIPWRFFVECAVLFGCRSCFTDFMGCTSGGRGNRMRSAHPWMANWLYVLQRWTGIIAFVFIVWHCIPERFAGQGRTNYQDLADAMSHPGYLAFYIVGVTAASFHLGNGLWNFACKWGIAVTVKAQRAAGWFGAAVTVALTFVGIVIAMGFRIIGFR